MIRSPVGSLRSAHPDAVVGLAFAQIPLLPEDAGRELVDEVVAGFPASTWCALLSDRLVAGWPRAAAERAVGHVLALPEPVLRLETACRLAQQLPEREPIYEALLAGQLPERVLERPPETRLDLIAGFLSTLPLEQRERWIAGRVGAWERRRERVVREALARDRAQAWTEDAARVLWAALRWEEGRDPPTDLTRLARVLPPDLRAVAVERLRGCSEFARRWHLARFDADLTDADRADVVDTRPWTHERDLVFQLLRVAPLLRGQPAARDRWLRVAWATEAPRERQSMLIDLVPHLEGPERDRAVDEILVIGVRERSMVREPPWALFAPERLPELVWALAADEVGADADEAIRHVCGARPPEVADACFGPVLAGLDGRPADRRLEIWAALSPWVAARLVRAGRGPPRRTRGIGSPVGIAARPDRGKPPRTSRWPKQGRPSVPGRGRAPESATNERP